MRVVGCWKIIQFPTHLFATYLHTGHGMRSDYTPGTLGTIRKTIFHTILYQFGFLYLSYFNSKLIHLMSITHKRTEYKEVQMIPVKNMQQL